MSSLQELNSEIGRQFHAVEQQWHKYTEKDSVSRHSLIKALNLYYRVYEHEMAEFSLAQFNHVYKAVKRIDDQETSSNDGLIQVVREIKQLLERIHHIRELFRNVQGLLSTPDIEASIRAHPSVLMQLESLRTFLAQWDSRLESCLKPVESHRQLSYFVGSTLNAIMSQIEMSVEKFNELNMAIQSFSPRSGPLIAASGLPAHAQHATSQNGSGTSFAQPPGGTFLTNPSGFGGALAGSGGGPAVLSGSGNSGPHEQLYRALYSQYFSTAAPLGKATMSNETSSAMDNLVASLRAELRKDFEARLQTLEAKLSDTQGTQWQLWDEKLNANVLQEKLEKSVKSLDTRCMQLDQKLSNVTKSIDGAQEDFNRIKELMEDNHKKLDSRQQIFQQDMESVWEKQKESRDGLDKRTRALEKRANEMETCIRRLESRTADLHMDLESTWSQIKEALARSENAITECHDRVGTLFDDRDSVQQKQANLEQTLQETLRELELTREAIRRKLDETIAYTDDKVKQIWIRQQLRDISRSEHYGRVNEDPEWRENFVRLAARQLGSNAAFLESMATHLKLHLTPGTTQFSRSLEFLRQWALKSGGYLPLEELITELLDVPTPVFIGEENGSFEGSVTQHPGVRIATVLLNEMQFRVDQLARGNASNSEPRTALRSEGASRGRRVDLRAELSTPPSIKKRAAANTMGASVAAGDVAPLASNALPHIENDRSRTRLILGGDGQLEKQASR